jgi:hypothetical protein
MVYLLPGHDLVLCWESTTIGSTTDVIFGTSIRGVRLTSLSEVLAQYPGTVWWRPLRGSRSTDFRWEVDELRHQLHGRPYEKSLLALVGAALKQSWKQPAYSLTSLFCSELYAATLQGVQVLQEITPPGEYTPDDFLPGGFADKHVVSPWSWGDLAQVLPPP